MKAELAFVPRANNLSAKIEKGRKPKNLCLEQAALDAPAVTGV